MKRIFTFGLMLVGAFTLTNCAEELVDPTILPDEITQETITSEKGGIPFQIYASLDSAAETKTVGVNDNGVLKTQWQADDKIMVYYQSIDNNTLMSAGAFGFAENATEEDIANGLFSGVLPESFVKDGTYNWYFVYKGTVTSTGDITITIPEVQTQIEENDPTHIGGINCPMWGTAKNISGLVKPRVQMEHLVSLYKFTVRNSTNETIENSTSNEGDIRIYEVGMQVSTSGEWTSSNQQAALAGEFKLDIKTGKITQVGGLSNSYGIKLKLKESSIELAPKEESVFYFVTAPVDVQSLETTETRYQSNSDANNIIKADEYNGLQPSDKANYKPISVRIRLDVLDFIVNGSARPLPGRDAFNYEKGKIYKYKLPIKRLGNPHSSDIFDLNSEGGRKTTDGKSTDQIDEIIKIYKSAPKSGEWEEAQPTTINVNGQNVEGYVIGNQDGTVGAITLTCFAKDLFNALPVGFYLSTWNGSPGEMTIDNIKIWIPEYETSSSENIQEITDRVGTANEYTVTRLVRTIQASDYTQIKARANSTRMKEFGVVGNAAYYLLGGDECFKVTGDLLLQFAPGLGSKIPFSNFSKQGYYPTDTEGGAAYNSVVMNDAYSYKAISEEANLGSFLAGFGASLSGIIELLNMKDDDLPAAYQLIYEREEDIKYKKPGFFESLMGATGITITDTREKEMKVSPAWPPVEGDTLYGKKDIISTITTVYNALMSKELAGYNVGSMLLTNPYDLIYMLRDSKVSIELKTTSNGPCVVMWGIDVLGPDESPDNN